MTIDEAIKNLTLIDTIPPSGVTGVFLASIELGIEALMEVRKARKGDPALDGELLPGETEKP